MDDFDLDALLDDTLNELEEPEKPEAKVSTSKTKVQILGAAETAVAFVDGIYRFVGSLNEHDSFKKEEPSDDLPESIVLWFDKANEGWALSLESNVQSSKIIARCLQNREHVWNLNRVWDIWDDSSSEFVPIISLKVQPHSDCPIDDFEIADLFQSAGVNMGKEAALDNAADMFADDAERMHEEAAASGWDGDPAAALMQMFGDFNFSEDGGDDSFENMLMKWMKQILKKDVIFEPIQIISSKFPEWLEKNREATTSDQFELYEKQYEIIQEIETQLSESEEPDMAQVMEKFNQMMEVCSFPQELLEEVFGTMGVDINDLGSLSDGAQNLFEMDAGEQEMFNNLARSFMNSDNADNSAASSDNMPDPGECVPS